jgi:hypothetical protein
MSVRIASAVLVALLIAVCAGGASADAATIRACAKKKTGAMRLVAKGKRCKASERKLTWNAKGPAGAPGQPGAAGAQGPAGTKGDVGAQGPQGQPGDGGFLGSAAGGDLAGTFPNPQIAGNAIGGPEVGDDALTGADIDESTLGQVPDSDLLDGLNSTAFLLAAGKAADSNLLDGIDSTGFLGAAGKAADSDLLDGIDSTALLHKVASGSSAIDFGLIGALTCASSQIGSSTAHGAQVLVNNAYDQSALGGALPVTLLDVNAVRVANGAGDDIYVKVCNLNPISGLNPSSVTFDWMLVG